MCVASAVCISTVHTAWLILLLVLFNVLGDVCTIMGCSVVYLPTTVVDVIIIM